MTYIVILAFFQLFKEKPIYVSTFLNHTCYLTSEGNVYCRGEGPGVITYTNKDAVKVVVGMIHTCILTKGGNVYCHGDKKYKLVVDYVKGDAIDVDTGIYYTCILTKNGNVYCHGDDKFGKPPIYTKGDAIKIDVSGGVVSILTSKGNVYWYGLGKLLFSYTEGDAVDVSGGFIVTSKGNVKVWNITLGKGISFKTIYDKGDAVKVFASKFYHSIWCVLTSKRVLYCFGEDPNDCSYYYTKEGTIAGSCKNEKVPILSHLNGSKDVVSVSFGNNHACVVKSTASYKSIECYGKNDAGEVFSLRVQASIK